jgi:hypothetical protein
MTADKNERGHIAKFLRAAPITSAVERIEVGGVPADSPSHHAVMLASGRLQHDQHQPLF